MLKIPIKKYYACEINCNAIDLGMKNFETKIIYLGNVLNMNSNKLHEIGPIDLLLGASPCNDLSLANPKRKGIYGKFRFKTKKLIAISGCLKYTLNTCFDSYVSLCLFKQGPVPQCCTSTS